MSMSCDIFLDGSDCGYEKCATSSVMPALSVPQKKSYSSSTADGQTWGILFSPDYRITGLRRVGHRLDIASERGS